MMEIHFLDMITFYNYLIEIRFDVLDVLVELGFDNKSMFL